MNRPICSDAQHLRSYYHLGKHSNSYMDVRNYGPPFKNRKQQTATKLNSFFQKEENQSEEDVLYEYFRWLVGKSAMTFVSEISAESFDDT